MAEPEFLANEVPSSAKRSPFFSTLRSTSDVSNVRSCAFFCFAHRCTSSAVTGVDTVGRGRARTEYTATVVFAGWFWLQSINTRPCRSDLRMLETTRSRWSDSSLRAMS